VVVKQLGIQTKFLLVPDRFTYFGQMTGSPSRSVRELLEEGKAASVTTFAKQRQALSVLKDLPTARLNRLLSEHLDLCSYRLDAWFNAIILERLNVRPSTVATSRGIYLGAFGLLENVRPGTPATFAQEVTPVFSDQLDLTKACLALVNTKHLQTSGLVVDKVLKDSFIYLGDNPSSRCHFDFAKRKVVMLVESEPGNQGFLHAPSADHAVTAAILRAGWQSRQSEGGHDANTLAIRLDSPRV